MKRWLPMFGALLAVCFPADGYPARAQQVQITAPLHTLNDSFYENIGFGWGLSGGGRNRPWYFNSTPANATPPPFGGYDPGADASFGFGFAKGNTRGNFNMLAQQGSSRSMVMESPTIMLPNGGFGGLFSGSQRPFVTGVIPVVGNTNFGPGPMMPMPSSAVSPLQQRLNQWKREGAPLGDPDAERRPQAALPDAKEDAPLVMRGGQVQQQRAPSYSGGGASGDSTASRGDIGVAEIRRSQAQQDATLKQEIHERIQKGLSYEDAGKPSIAKIYYKQAATRASGELKRKILERIESLSQ